MRTSAWRGVAALTMARLAMGYQFQSVAASGPLLTGDLGLDKAQLGWLIGLFLLPGVMVALPGGLLGARFGDRRVTVTALLLMSAAGFWMALAPDFAQMSWARVLCGAGAVVLTVLATKIVADGFEGRDRVLAMGVLIASWPIGIGLALIVIGPLAQAFGWRTALLSSGGLALLGAVLVRLFVAPPAKAAVPSSGPRPAGTAAGWRAGFGLRVLEAREWRLLGIGSLPWLLYNIGYQSMVSFLPSYFVDAGYAMVDSGNLTAASVLVIVISLQMGGVLPRWVRRPERWYYASALCWCACLVLMTVVPWSPWFWVLAGGFLAGLPGPAYVSLPGEFLRPESRGAGMGVFYTIYYLGCAVLPTFIGAMYDLTGRGSTALWLAAAFAAASVPADALARRALRRGAHQAAGAGPDRSTST